MKKFIFALLILPSCATTPRPTAPSAPKFCIIRPALKSCFMDQKAGQSISIDVVDGFFAVDPADLETMLDKLDSCRDK